MTRAASMVPSSTKVAGDLGLLPRVDEGRYVLLASKDVTATVRGTSDVHVVLNLRASDVSRSLVDEALENISRAITTLGATRKVSRGDFLTAIAEALVARTGHGMAGEIDRTIVAYGAMLRDSVAKGPDENLKRALNRARLQERILADVTMADQAEACELLGLSTTNPSTSMKRREERRELLRFNVDGRAAYPLFQFDVENRRVFPIMKRLIARAPEGWSDFRLLNWLSQPLLEFGQAPAELLGTHDDEILAAFERAIEPPDHG